MGVPIEELAVGDIVTVQFRDEAGSFGPEDLITISGRLRLSDTGSLVLGVYVVRFADGVPGGSVGCVTEHLRAEPPVGAVVKDDDGDYWVHLPEGWAFIPSAERERPLTWTKLNESYSVVVLDHI